MTKWGIHPMVILWSSYGDPMVRVLFWGYLPKKYMYICISQKKVVSLHPK